MLSTDVAALVADTTDYIAGLEAKGNGFRMGGAMAIGNDVGYWIYKINKWIDLGIDFTDIWGACSVDYFTLSMSRAFTSISGLLNTGVNLAWRFLNTGDEDNTALWSNMSLACDSYASSPDNAAEVGSAFGKWIVAVFMTEVPATSDITYQLVNYIQ